MARTRSPSTGWPRSWTAAPAFWKVIVLGGFAAIGGVWKRLTGRGKTTTA